MHKGFTLLEMLVVLSLIGLMVGLVAPDLMTMTDRIAFAMNREKLEHSLAAMPYEAYRQKKDMILESSKTASTKAPQPSEEDGISIVLSTKDAKIRGLVEVPVLVAPAPLVLPTDWSITVEAPILYRAAGYCNGGQVAVSVGSLVYQYELKAPDCQPVIK